MDVRKEQRLARAGMAASVAAAVGASLCCIGPVAAAMFGVTSLATLVKYEPLRPYLAVITLGFLGAAFYATYRRRPAEQCAAGSVCETRPVNRVMLWIATLIAVAALTFPTWSGTAAAATPHKTATTNLHIDGMTCGGCATAVKLVLKKTPGVVGSTVSYEEKRAVVTYDPAKTTPAKVAEAVASALAYKVNVEGAAAPIALSPYRLDALRSAFNQDSDHVRVIALLSPTCPYCQKGQRVVQSVFEKHPNDDRLRGFVVWLPMLPTDNPSAAGAQAGSFVDARVAQQWDGDRASGETFAKMLGLKRNAWDVYLLYAPGVKWTGDAPPTPTFWMHQLRADSGADQRVCLNPTVFLSKVAGLLAERKARV